MYLLSNSIHNIINPIFFIYFYRIENNNNYIYNLARILVRMLDYEPLNDLVIWIRLINLRIITYFLCVPLH